MTQHSRVRMTFFGILVLGIITGLLVLPNLPDKPYFKFFRDFSLKLGLDLQGGTFLVYEADLTEVEEAKKDEAMGGVRDVIERRVNAFGVSEPEVRVSGKKRLNVELAGVKEVSEAIALIGETPTLDFREPLSAEETAELLGEQTGEEAQIPFEGVLFKPTDLTGKDLERSEVQFDPQTNEPTVSLQFNDQGKELFAQITEKNLGQPVAIYLDGEAITTPVVQAVINDGRAVITGDFDIQEAQQLATRLNAGALPVPIELISQQTVGASLGSDSVARSLQAGIIGLILVAIYMIAYYRLPGLLAVVALGVYITTTLAIFEVIPVVLTLAGIAGLLISIGMAVDANILIFERMKEELRSGQELDVAIEEGFRHAWNSIRDSNVSSLITCLILIWFGTSMIQGFAYTLGIGVIVSMFSAVWITRTFLRLIYIYAPRTKHWLFGAGFLKTKTE